MQWKTSCCYHFFLKKENQRYTSNICFIIIFNNVIILYKSNNLSCFIYFFSIKIKIKMFNLCRSLVEFQCNNLSRQFLIILLAPKFEINDSKYSIVLNIFLASKLYIESKDHKSKRCLNPCFSNLFARK